MESVASYNAIVIPFDDRRPHLASLLSTRLEFAELSARPAEVYRAGLMPHPEILMDDIEKSVGPRSWRFQISVNQNIEALDGMNTKFDRPYIIFFPVVSKSGRAFPLNTHTRNAQERMHTFKKAVAWRGDLVIAKYADLEYTQMMNISIADFPLVINYLSTFGRNQGPASYGA